jgi:translation elongation factor EF-1alpha
VVGSCFFLFCCSFSILTHKQTTNLFYLFLFFVFLTFSSSGHVDAGKSTLMGQVLVQTGQVSARTVTRQHQGHLAFLLDENDSERQRGVTMEIGTKTLTVPHHDIVLLDAPGHADFIPV